ncbi:MAG: hypothetical protein ABIJ96_02390 [Elusimicrobiota bacterium]
MRRILARQLALSLALSGWSAPLRAYAACPSAAGLNRLGQLAQGEPLRQEDFPLTHKALRQARPECGADCFAGLLLGGADGAIRLTPPGKQLLIQAAAQCAPYRFLPAGPRPALPAKTVELRGAGTPLRNLTQPDGGRYFDGAAELKPAVAVGAARGASYTAAVIPARVTAKHSGLSLNRDPPAPALEYPEDIKAKKEFWGRLKGMFGSMASFYANQITGAGTWVHEKGHEIFIRLLHNPKHLEVQVDGIENMRNVGRAPSWDSLKKFLGSHDTHQDGAAGYASYGGFQDTPLGTRLGDSASTAIISAAGSLAQDVPAIAGYAAGFMLRKKHPAIGYTLMTTSMMNHFVNSLYLWSAVGMSAEQLAAAGRSGHDWAKFATATQIHPVITALAFTAILPLEALTLHYASKAYARKVNDRRALGSLIEKGDIAEIDLLALYELYPGRDKLQLAEARLSELMQAYDKKRGAESIAGMQGAAGIVAKEFEKFQSYVIKTYRAELDAEIERLPKIERETLANAVRQVKAYYRARYRADKLGTGMEVGTIGVGAAAGVAAAARAAGLAAAGTALEVMIPGLGALGVASGLHRTRKALRDASLNGVEKTLAVVQHASGAVGSLGMITAEPLMMLGGMAGSLTALGARWLYGKWRERKERLLTAFAVPLLPCPAYA